MNSKRYPEAARKFRRAVEVEEVLAAKDPRNEYYQRHLSNYLSRLADSVAKSGDMGEGRVLTRRALDVLMPLVNKESAQQLDLYQYAWILLTTPFQDLRDPAKALAYAAQLAEATHGEDPRMLDLLARAYAGTGNFERAVETETRALNLLPRDLRSDLKEEIETNLAEFRSGPATSRARRKAQ